jgi:hypothetical protein
MKPLWLLLLVLTGCISPLPASPLTGIWRSIQAEVSLGKQGGSIEFGCARGTIGTVNLNARGEFRVAGTYTQLSPVEHIGEPPPVVQPVTYSGKVAANRLTFSLEFADGRKGGETSAVKDSSESVLRCA